MLLKELSLAEVQSFPSNKIIYFTCPGKNITMVPAMTGSLRMNSALHVVRENGTFDCSMDILRYEDYQNEDSDACWTAFSEVQTSLSLQTAHGTIDVSTAQNPPGVWVSCLKKDGSTQKLALIECIPEDSEVLHVADDKWLPIIPSKRIANPDAPESDQMVTGGIVVRVWPEGDWDFDEHIRVFFTN